MLKTSKAYSVKAITKKIEQGSLVFDNAVQRGLVWDVKRSSLLIDSLIRDYPVPPFYAVVDGRKIETAKGEISVLDCIDGKQRCNAIHSYMTDGFALKGLEPFPTEDGAFDANGLKFSELPEELQDALKDSSLLCYSFSDCSDDDVIEVMARLNNGKPLSAADITRVRAADLDGIKRIASHPLFMEHMAQKQRDGRQNEDVTVKMYLHLTYPFSGLDNKDTRPIYESWHVSADDESMLNGYMDTLKAVLDELKGLAEAKDKDAKQAYKTLCKKTHLISFVDVIAWATADGTDLQNIVDFAISFFGGAYTPSISEDYNNACSNGSNHAPAVHARHIALNDVYYGTTSEQ